MNESDKPDEVREEIERIVEAAGFSVMPDHEFDQVVAEMGELAKEHEAFDRAIGKKFLDEEKDAELVKEWLEQARTCKRVSDASAFAQRLLDDYHHDYGTICHALAAGAVAMAWGMNGEGGGITGFQSGFVFWGFFRGWMQEEGRHRLVNYRDMLYPQMEDKFTTINDETWTWLQAEAKKNLSDSTMAHPDVIAHWRSVAGGAIPFGYKVGAS